MRLWDATTGQLLNTLTGHGYNIDIFSFSVDGNTIATANSRDTVRLWDVSTGKLLKTLTGRTCHISSVFFLADGDIIATGSSIAAEGDEGAVCFWDANTGQLLKTFPNENVARVYFSVDGQTFACIYDGDGTGSTGSLFSATTGQLLKEIFGNAGGIISVEFSPDGKTIATGNDDGTILLWEVP